VAGPGVVPTLGGAELLDDFAAQDVRVDPVDLARVDSSALGFAQCQETLELASAAVLAGEADGVVVVQGTDTLEETAYFWDLQWSHAVPFVVTGAMRPAGAAGADGPANLRSAVAVAASPDFAHQGVLVALGGEVHAARYVTKRHSWSPAAFTSPDLGPVGHVGERGPVCSARVARREALPAPVRLRRVALLRACLDDDPRLYRAAGELADALVVEGFGAGQVRPEVGPLLLELARDRPVVLASRTGAGGVATGTYRGPGSGTDLVAGGVVPAGRLSGLQARVLLQLLVSAARLPTPQEVALAFGRHGG
jgi:L-asparaginase